MTFLALASLALERTDSWMMRVCLRGAFAIRTPDPARVRVRRRQARELLSDLRRTQRLGLGNETQRLGLGNE